MGSPARHQCLVYSGPPSQHLRGLAAQTIKSLNENYRCIHMNSPTMNAGLRSTLAALGLDVAHETERGSLIISSGQDHLVNGRFDADSMLKSLEEAIDGALNDGYRGLWASGDMSWEFGPQKDFKNLLEYEWRLEELFHRRSALLGICQYNGDTLPREVMRDGLESHTSIFVNETLSMVNPYYVRRPLFTHGTMTITTLDSAIEDLCKLSSAV
jgi:MEDS: MEthanogen/methylotroph, DcmR Sensory domain